VIGWLLGRGTGARPWPSSLRGRGAGAPTPAVEGRRPLQLPPPDAHRVLRPPCAGGDLGVRQGAQQGQLLRRPGAPADVRRVRPQPQLPRRAPPPLHLLRRQLPAPQPVSPRAAYLGVQAARPLRAPLRYAERPAPAPDGARGHAPPVLDRQ
jgi:hypothetical protein